MIPKHIQRLVHYGAIDTLRNAKLNKAGRRSDKPAGSDLLWTSPRDSVHSWSQWCEGENYGLAKGQSFTRYEITLSPTANVAVIDGPHQLAWFVEHFTSADALPELKSFVQFDWEAIAERWHALWLTEEGEYTTRYETPGLYGWDCETVVIFDAAKVCRVEEFSELMEPIDRAHT